MIYVVCSLFDKAAACFNPPQFVPAAGVAVRQFEDMVNGDATVISRHPEHFELYQVARFDDANGLFLVAQAPELLCNGASLVRSPARQV